MVQSRRGFVNLWARFCPECGGPKTERAKKCKECRSLKPLVRKRRRRKRQSKEQRGAIPTQVTLADSSIIQTRSKLEAAWILALEICTPCYECLQVPIPHKGRKGTTFTGTYTPDLIIGDIYVELKSDAKYAKKDNRQVRAMELNKGAKFLVIGGYPSESLYVKLVSSEGVKEYNKMKLDDVIGFLGCGESN